MLFGADNEPANTSFPRPNPHVLLLITRLTLKISHLSHSQYKPSIIQPVPQVRHTKVGHKSRSSLMEAAVLVFFFLNSQYFADTYISLHEHLQGVVPASAN